MGVGALADRLPRVTPWLSLLFTAPAPSAPPAIVPAPNNAGPGELAAAVAPTRCCSGPAAVAPTPRPPAEPPPGGSRGSAAARPHLARRMMQRLTGVTAETRAADAGMSAPLRTN